MGSILLTRPFACPWAPLPSSNVRSDHLDTSRHLFCCACDLCGFNGLFSTSLVECHAKERVHCRPGCLVPCHSGRNAGFQQRSRLVSTCVIWCAGVPTKRGAHRSQLRHVRMVWCARRYSVPSRALTDDLSTHASLSLPHRVNVTLPLQCAKFSGLSTSFVADFVRTELHTVLSRARDCDRCCFCPVFSCLLVRCPHS